MVTPFKKYLRKGNNVAIVYRRCKKCLDYKIIKGKIEKVGKKFVYLEDGGYVEKELIVDVYSLNDKEREYVWKRYFEEYRKWEDKLNEIENNIKQEEYKRYLERVKRRLEEYKQKNPPPKLPLSNS